MSTEEIGNMEGYTKQLNMVRYGIRKMTHWNFIILNILEKLEPVRLENYFIFSGLRG